MTLDFVPTLFMTISEKGRSVESVSHGTASFAVTLPHPMVSARRLYHLFGHTGEALVSVANSASSLILLCLWAETAPIYGGSVRHSLGFPQSVL